MQDVRMALHRAIDGREYEPRGPFGQASFQALSVVSIVGDSGMSRVPAFDLGGRSC